MSTSVQPKRREAVPTPQIFPHPGRRPARPDDDPFHVPPDGFEDAAPGSILHARPVDIGFLGRMRQRVTAWQLLYRTTDPAGAPEVTVTTVLVPADHDPRSPRLLAYQCAINSSERSCFPSYCLLQGARGPFANPQVELLLMAAALRQGWIVSVADHGGQPGRYVVARQPGYHVLDGLRAALGFGELRLPVDTPIGLWGYSGGGLASSWTAEMAPSYAPELNIAAAALGSPASDPSSILERADGGLFAGLGIAAISALRGSYPALDSVLTEHLTSRGEKIMTTVRGLSTGQAIGRYAMRSLDRYVDLPISELMALPGVTAMSEDLRLGKAAPTCPVYIYTAVRDQLVGIDEVDHQASFYAAHGTDVTYRRDRLSEHLSLVVLGAPAALRWLAQRLEGMEPESGTRTVMSMLASTPALWTMALMSAAAARVLTGRQL
ncbi:lipase family protein [Mycobacteroides saopaulense]|uniref:lipase family protein n=1 Tax=Mycobacteroides saopaulense TaxID=1578165 RepID=UPI000B4C9EC5|nr:lipase family protein [Mycobacteroides saopaulense]